jgi:hypothetical protein
MKPDKSLEKVMTAEKMSKANPTFCLRLRNLDCGTELSIRREVKKVQPDATHQLQYKTLSPSPHHQ